MRSKCVKHSFGGSKIASEVARRGQRVSWEPSKATKEASEAHLCDSTAFLVHFGHWKTRKTNRDGGMRRPLEVFDFEF